MRSAISASVLPGNGRRRRQHLVEHDAGREQVGAMIDGGPAQLLGRHVVERAQHQARRRHPGERSHLAAPRGALQELRQAEVEHLHQLPRP